MLKISSLYVCFKIAKTLKTTLSNAHYLAELLEDLDDHLLVLGLRAREDGARRVPQDLTDNRRHVGKWPGTRLPTTPTLRR